ncbi:MAG: guanylate kinase [Fimbriimonadales bacterium]|nr:guanylate kinase [Fimbriimonadales bacterium]
MSGSLVIVSGPSGVGKDTVIRRWLETDPRLERVVTCTTRPPRPNDVPGVTYHFLNRQEFLRRAREGHLLEYKEVHGNLYGTPLAGVQDILGRGKIAVLNIDVQGGTEVLAKRPDAIGVFLLPPSMEELERRLRSRAEDSEEQIRLRLRNAIEEMRAASAYPHQLVNDDVDRCAAALSALVPRT